MKKNSTIIKELKKELHHWQMIVRQERRWAAQSENKVRTIAKKMRELVGL